MSWKRILTTTAIYFVTELLLNISGLDTVANYSEFIFAHKQDRISEIVRLM
jgi:hypothetical protein